MKKNDYDTEDFPEVANAFKMLEKELKAEEKNKGGQLGSRRRRRLCKSL